MKISKPENRQPIELPLQLKISFEKVFLMYKKYTGEDFKEHPFLASVYDYNIDLKRPFFFDIPDKKSGMIRDIESCL